MNTTLIDERRFRTRLKAFQTAEGTVNEVLAPPPHDLHYRTMYVVDVLINRQQRFKFTIINRNRCWRVDLLSVLSRSGKLRSIDSFAVENRTVEGAFEDALNALATYKNHIVDYA